MNEQLLARFVRFGFVLVGLLLIYLFYKKSRIGKEDNDRDILIEIRESESISIEGQDIQLLSFESWFLKELETKYRNYPDSNITTTLMIQPKAEMGVVGDVRKAIKTSGFQGELFYNLHTEHGNLSL